MKKDNRSLNEVMQGMSAVIVREGKDYSNIKWTKKFPTEEGYYLWKYKDEVKTFPCYRDTDDFIVADVKFKSGGEKFLFGDKEMNKYGILVSTKKINNKPVTQRW